MEGDRLPAALERLGLDPTGPLRAEEGVGEQHDETHRHAQNGQNENTNVFQHRKVILRSLESLCSLGIVVSEVEPRLAASLASPCSLGTAASGVEGRWLRMTDRSRSAVVSQLCDFFHNLGD